MTVPGRGATLGVVARRLVTIPALFAAWAVLVVTAPVTVVAAYAVDTARRVRGAPTVRLVAFGVAFTTYEVLGVLAAFALWLARPWRRDLWEARNHRLQQWWTASLVRAAGPVLGLRLEVEAVRPDGGDGTGVVALDAPGPIVVLSRHVSVVDSLLPAHLLGVEHGRRLRYVLTRGLRLDPCLDIVGHRLPNHFVDRGGEDPAQEIAALEALATGLGGDDAAVIFPEGGLYSPARRERAIRRLAERGSPRLAVARSLRHLLAPRAAGTLALLRAAPDADVVVLAHHGFEPLASIGALWRNAPLAGPVRLRAVRHDRRCLPGDEPGLARWLDEQWATMDGWLDRQGRRGDRRTAGATG